MTVLYLTPKEHLQFASAPAPLREGFDVEEETLVFRDSPAHRALRFKQLRLQDPALLALVQRASSAGVEEELLATCRDLDPARASDRDLAELCFLIGPEGISALLFERLRTLQSAHDLDGIAALAAMRHAMLLSLVSSPPS